MRPDSGVMSSYSAPIDIFRAAMPLIGGRVPTSLDDNSAQANVFNATYGGIVEDLLSRHSWSFATKRATLAYQGETGDSPAYAYVMPADVLALRRVLLSLADFDEYELRGGRLLCNVSQTEDLDIIYTWRAGESDWPSDFAQGVVYKIAAVMLRSLLDRAGQAEAMDQRAEMKIRMASVRDRRSSGRLPFQSNPSLVRAWRGSNRNEGRSNAATIVSS